MKKGFTLIELLVVVVMVGVLGAVVAGIGLTVLSSSEGSRVGVVTKVSKRGIICKTWEAQMMVGAVTQGQGGSYTPEVWSFTPADDAVQSVKDAMVSGQRVEIEYKQRPKILTLCKSDTGYFATAVKPTGK